jgi:lipopolysaccharide export system permease protein
MKTLFGYSLRQFLPVFTVALLFFILILQLVDLFSNLWKYLDNDATISQILTVQLYYLPKCALFAIPISLLFSTSFTLGTFYSNNELIIVFGSGIPLFRFIVPFVLAGVLLSAGSFFLEEYVVIETYKQKNALSRTLLNQTVSFSNTNVTVLSDANRIIYNADYYNDNTQTLSGLIVLFRDDDGAFLRRIDAEWGSWKNERWELRNCRVFSWDADHERIVETSSGSVIEPLLVEPPSTFRKTVRNVEEMRFREAREWIDALRKAGLPFRESLTVYYKRFSFALSCLIVTFISGMIGGSFKKNILLMSLLISLIISVLFYVTQMVTVIMANLGYISPITGAFSPFFLFIVSGAWLVRFVKT